MDIAVRCLRGRAAGQRDDAIYDEGGTRSPLTRHVRLAGYPRGTMVPKSQVTLRP
jgi:hypothetical protein